MSSRISCPSFVRSMHESVLAVLIWPGAMHGSTYVCTYSRASVGVTPGTVAL